ncbi:DUF4397 domain-containing protein [Haloarchaeobius sp. DFWS5]|uniref:DUF4397 domain-containing protein n=1 Tax=Haloarchaeobius sp. DFWS5 TaxID=3446114 RepID=UPI003EBEC8B1
MTEIPRRTVLKGIGAGTAIVAGATGSALGATAGAAEENAGLRVAHASPDAPAVDVLVDGSAVVEGLEFGTVTDYLEVPPGEYEVAVNAAGTDQTVFGPVAVELEAAHYTAVARGEVTSEDSEFTVSLFQDTYEGDLGDDEARVRAIHASPDAPQVDVTVDDDALTVFDNVAYGESSGYTTVPAGTYDVEVRPCAGGDAVFEVSDVPLEGGTTYTVFAIGYLSPDDDPSDESFRLKPVVDASAPGDGSADERVSTPRRRVRQSRLEEMLARVGRPW